MISDNNLQANVAWMNRLQPHIPPQSLISRILQPSEVINSSPISILSTNQNSVNSGNGNACNSTGDGVRAQITVPNSQNQGVPDRKLKEVLKVSNTNIAAIKPKTNTSKSISNSISGTSNESSINSLETAPIVPSLHRSSSSKRVSSVSILPPVVTASNVVEIDVQNSIVKDQEPIIDLTQNSKSLNKTTKLVSSSRLKRRKVDIPPILDNSTQIYPEIASVEVRTLTNDSRSTESILRQIIAIQDEKISMLEERFQVSNSTSISFDAKRTFYKLSSPKLQLFETKLSQLKSELHSISDSVSEQSNGILPIPVAINQPIRLEPNTDTLEEVLKTTSTGDGKGDVDEELLELTQNDFRSNINEAREYVLERRELTSRVERPSATKYNVDVSDVDSEDHFGEHSMDGLRTPTQERDESDDLGSFIDHNESGIEVDQTFQDSDKSDIESLLGDSLHDELDNIKLSQDVALKFGISYENSNIDKDTIEEVIDDAVSISSEEDEIEEIEDFTTQLNEERELNNEVIEILSDVDEDFESNYLPPIKVENSSPIKILSPRIPPTNDSDIDFSDDDDELMKIINGAPIPGPSRKTIPAGSERFIEDVYSTLNNVFKLKDFRQNQLEAITALLQGKDVFVLMPTGGGKSLCYQLPALIKSGKTKGTTVVISPLISLMQDQVQHLLDKNIKAGMLSAKATLNNNKNSYNLFRDGLLDLVYLSPEMANKSANVQRIITRLYENKQLARVVIDEAHCLSSWGHDFRPDYQGMSVFKLKYPGVPIMALTATANEKVRLDIVHHLGIENAVLLKQSFNRSNLYYEIKEKTNTHLEWIKDYILGKQRGKTGIIYCNTKQLCEQTSEKLNEFGVNTSYYHAGLSSEARHSVQTDWQSGRLQLICATIAFGMGIDKSDVRYVIHLCLPRTLEGYYQETGRAGRDGKQSDCIMFYSYRDARQIQSMIQRDEELNEVGKENHMEKLRQVVQYCSNTTDCRRKQVLHYFNEIFEVHKCNKQCDNCKNSQSNSVIQKDCTDYAKDILNLVQSIQHERVTVLQCQDIFKGSKSNKIIRLGYHNNPYHGKGKDLEKTDIERIFLDLLFDQYLDEYYVMRAGFASNYVRLGKNSDRILRGQLKIKIQFSNPVGSRDTMTTNRSSTTTTRSNLNNFRFSESFVSAREVQTSMAPPSSTSRNDDEHIAHSYRELNKIRIDILNEQRTSPNQIMHENTMRDMAIKLPTNKRDFGKLNEISKTQVENFNHFKKLLGSLSRERKKQTGSQSTYFTNTQDHNNRATTRTTNEHRRPTSTKPSYRQNNRTQSQRSQKSNRSTQRPKVKGLPL